MPVIKNILCPIDFSKCSERSLDYAAGLAKTLGADMHLVHAYVDPLASIPFGRAGTAGPPAADPEVISDARSKRQREIERLQKLCENHGVNTSVREVEGEPRKVICETAESEKVDLIIMGTHGRTGAARALIGSVSERVVRTAPCPVLVVP